MHNLSGAYWVAHKLDGCGARHLLDLRTAINGDTTGVEAVNVGNCGHLLNKRLIPLLSFELACLSYPAHMDVIRQRAINSGGRNNEQHKRPVVDVYDYCSEQPEP